MGDAAIYPYLHDTYYNSLVYFSLSIIQDQQQAEDIAVDSLVKLWEMPTRFETIGKLRSYLFTLVRNSSLNYLKHLKVRERKELELSRTEVMVDSKLEALVVESDLMRLVYQEVALLPESYRQVVLRTSASTSTVSSVSPIPVIRVRTWVIMLYITPNGADHRKMFLPRLV